MRFMGDQPKLKNQNEVECIYEILQELSYSKCPQFFLFYRDSVLRGWLLLNLLTGYFLPSNILMPYATKFLQLAGSDPSSTHQGMTVSVSCKINRCICLCGSVSCRMAYAWSWQGRVAQRCAGKLLSQAMELSPLSWHRVTTLSLHKHVDKTVRPIRSEEYLHDYLLEDKLVTVTLRRLIWRTPLHFENKIYTDVHYGQVQWDYLNGRILLSRSKEMEIEVGVLAVLQHWAKTEQQNSVPSRYVSRWASISDGQCHREHVMKLPFFGYNIYFVKRVSDDTIPVPCFFGVNKEEIIVVDGTTQVFSCVIPLKELQKMRTLQPVSDGGLPGIELNYGSAASPKAMWLELSQAKEMYHTIVVILDRRELQH
uniref:MyTH4 domain-containing protein n=1 Tax=Falco tinnunculus TaxID=100819 RepID=A0A8C4UVI0_FALTI